MKLTVLSRARQSIARLKTRKFRASTIRKKLTPKPRSKPEKRRPTGGSRSALLPILSPAFGVVTGAMVAAMMFSTLCLALLGALLLFLAASARAAQTAVVAIAAILALITAMEVTISYVHIGPLFLPVLLILMAVKFVTVVSYFMHLKFEGKLIYMILIVPVLFCIILVVSLLPDVSFAPIFHDFTAKGWRWVQH